MSDKPINSSWMWAIDGGVNGLVLDKETQEMRWYDAIGCACDMDDNAIEQTVALFRLEGPPVGIAPPPADVMAEVAESVASLAEG